MSIFDDFLNPMSYKNRFKDRPDSFMFKELHFLAAIRNNTGMQLEKEKLEQIVKTIFEEVKAEFPRKLWFKEANTRMSNFQHGKCTRNYLSEIS
jgi:hypothetical protein